MSSKPAPAKKPGAQPTPAAKPAANPAAKPAATAQRAGKSAAAIQNETFEQYVNRIALRFSMTAAAIGLLAVIILNWNRNPVPLQVDRRSFGSLALYITPFTVALFGGIGYVLGMREFNRRVAPRFQREWEIGGIPVGLGMALVSGFLITVGLELSANMFQGLEMAMAQGAFITAAIVGALTHTFIKYAMTMTGGRALQLTILSLSVGLYATATRMNNPEWWRVAFSHLGSMLSSVWYLFTIALVLAGLLMLVWLTFVMRDVKVLIESKRATPFAHTYFIGGILWLAIGISLVGLFPTQLGVISHWVHNIAAYSLALLFGLWFIGLSRALPKTPPELNTLSISVAVALVLTLIFAAIGYFNTVGLQVISFVIGITWLQEVVRYVALEAERIEPELNAV